MLAVVVGGSWFGLRFRAHEQRVAAEWKRIGSCTPLSASSETVTCRGVTLVEVSLPRRFAACDVIMLTHPTCSVPVNVEAAPAFRRAIQQIDAAGMGPVVTRFETVNRRRCKNAVTGGYIAGCVSKHSYGIAADIRPFADNVRWKSVVAAEPDLTRVIRIFERNGFRWGMHFPNNPDPQHVEWTP
jgi:D-alanyl-D-alanine carboxypeptidase